MSWTRETTVWCDICGEWIRINVPTVSEARKTAKAKGWSRNGEEDNCPSCTTNSDPQ